MPIFATEILNTGDLQDDNIITVEEQIEKIMDNEIFTEEQKEIALNKLNDDILICPKVIYHSITLSVPHCEQERSYWCGPATAQQTIRYLTGSADDQFEIARNMGTESQHGTSSDDLLFYINQNQSRNLYVSIDSPSFITFKKRINDGLSEYGAPPILRLNTKGVEAFSYHVSGHMLNLSGQNSGATLYRLTDPYITWVDSSSSGTYWIDEDSLYDAIENHPNPQFFY